MAECWVNAVLHARIPLDVSVDATNEEKLRAVTAKLDELEIHIPDAAITCGFEDVEDGERVA
jgi:hypothetical protein